MGAPPTATTFPQWPMFARLNEIDTSQVTLENIAMPVRVPMLAAGQLDAALGYSFRLYVDLKDRGVPVDDIVQMQMAGLRAQALWRGRHREHKFATERPDAVKGFLRATMRGIRDVSRNPSTRSSRSCGATSWPRRMWSSNGCGMAIRDNVLTPEVRANGLGAIDQARMEEAIAQIALGFTFKSRPKAEAVFDPLFLPPAAERRTH